MCSSDLYDNNIALFEDFFGRYGNEVPPYIQGLLVNDLSWKLKAGIALPTHLEGAAYDRALGRLGSLMERVDDDLILRHPNLREEHRLFALNLKCREPLRWRVAPGALAVLRGDALVFAAGCASATLTRIAVRDGELHVSGTLSSPFFAGWEGGVELLLRRRPRKADRGGSADALALTETVEACPTATVKLGRSFRFDFTCNLDESEDIWLDLRLDGVTIPLAWSVRGLARSAHALRHERIVGSWRVRADLDRSKIAVDRLEGKALQSALKQHDGRVPRWKTRLDRRLIRHLLAGSEIWLYSDGPDAEDEARTMFECDSLRDDGIVRYYAARSGQAAPRPGKHGRIVRFGSRRHKMLFCAAQRVIAPAADFATYSPMPEKSLLDFADLFNGEVETASADPL